MTLGRPTAKVLPDHFYLVEGRSLIALNLLSQALRIRVIEDRESLTRAELIQGLDNIIGALPVAPVEAF